MSERPSVIFVTRLMDFFFLVPVPGAVNYSGTGGRVGVTPARGGNGGGGGGGWDLRVMVSAEGVKVEVVVASGKLGVCDMDED